MNLSETAMKKQSVSYPFLQSSVSLREKTTTTAYYQITWVGFFSSSIILSFVVKRTKYFSFLLTLESITSYSHTHNILIPLFPSPSFLVRSYILVVSNSDCAT